MDTNLDLLVGEWELGGRHPQFGEATLGRTTFEWMTGEKFLVQRWTAELPEFPSGLAVLGPADGSGAYRQHYFDSRGVHRVYEMTLQGRVWTLERRDPDFWQRFRGDVAEDGRTIAGAWEKAAPHGAWEVDFHVTYARVG